MRRLLRSSLFVAATGVLASACFGDLRPVDEKTESDPFVLDANSALIEGIVAPKLIHAGDRVTLRDPARLSKDDGAPVLLWMACDGLLEPGSSAAEVLWTAPSTPGVYAVTVNFAINAHGAPSRVLRLCVAPPGATSCETTEAAPPTLRAVSAEKNMFVQETECEGSCTTRVHAEASPPGEAPLTWRWYTGAGNIVGTASTVDWQLPAVGCCTETYSAAVTVCGPQGTAATGYVNVVVIPG
ncbi:MAG: hypothetical protein HYV09_02975 [Deltaproteobacteria bacterium]|nr:hypothetical protein [Deltaproteobacteria bacterium]